MKTPRLERRALLILVALAAAWGGITVTRERNQEIKNRKIEYLNWGRTLARRLAEHEKEAAKHREVAAYYRALADKDHEGTRLRRDHEALAEQAQRRAIESEQAAAQCRKDIEFNNYILQKSDRHGDID
jgi:uncharacterized protein HemX